MVSCCTFSSCKDLVFDDTQCLSLLMCMRWILVSPYKEQSLHAELKQRACLEPLDCYCIYIQHQLMAVIALKSNNIV